MSSYPTRDNFERAHQNHTTIIGGEATVYIKGDTATKIYVDNGDVDISAKERKVKKLIRFSQKNSSIEAIFPEESIYIDGQFAGYTMRFVKNAKTLQEALNSTNSKLGEERRAKIVIKIAETIEKIHNAGFIIGDLHLNQILITNSYNIYFIDTDSWGIENDSDCVVDMVGDEEFVDPESINTSKRNPIINTYTKESDCYSLAIIAFYVLTGVHPFDGKYSIWRSMPKNIRAANKLSILSNHDIEYDKKIDLSFLSDDLINAFRDIFENGKRENIKDALIKQYGGLGIFTGLFKKILAKPSNNTNKAYYDYELDKCLFLPSDTINTIYNYEYYINEKRESVKIDVEGNTIKTEAVNDKMQIFYFSDDRYHIKIETLSFWQKFKMRSKYMVSLYKDNVVEKTFGIEDINNINIYGNYLYYIEKTSNSLIRITVGDDIEVTPIAQKNVYFEYEGNIDGGYIIISMQGNDLEVDIDGECTIFQAQIPLFMKYDELSKMWMMVTKKHNGRNNTIVFENGKKVFETVVLNYSTIELDACDFFKGMLYIPTEEKIIAVVLYSKEYIHPRISEIFVKGMSKECVIECARVNGSDYLYVYKNCNVYRL